MQEEYLDTIVDEMTGAVYGEITDRQVFRVDDPIDGPELYFTTLTIEGSSMVSNATAVCGAGGSSSPSRGGSVSG